MPATPANPSGATPESRALVARRHPEWSEHHLRWRWLLDSIEGGDRYRHAIYGIDRRGMPVMNLVRHKREYPDPRTAAGESYGLYRPDAAAGAAVEAPTDDDFALRLARTPVPTFVSEKVDEHLDRVFAREVDREGPAALDPESGGWWADVDGRGTPIDHWMRRTVAPLMLAAGQVDILMDHPPPPPGESVASQADVLRLDLSRCVASYILPENMVWWRLNARGRYAECLVRECPDGDDADAATRPSGPCEGALFRHWTAEGWTLYGDVETTDARGGTSVETDVIDEGTHAFGRVPIERLFAARKLRCTHVGQSPYEAVAERQREYYNRDSELILSDTTQAHPLLEGPEDYVEADGTIPIGPSWLLPKKKDGQTGAYEGFSVVDFPKGGAESIRANKGDLRDDIDRDAATLPPAGTTGTVGQSGLAKAHDSQRLNGKLGGLADTLAEAERKLAALALAVLGAEAGPDGVKVEYSKQFDLLTTDELGTVAARILELAAAPAAGRVPTINGEFLKAIYRQAMPGRDDATYAAWDAEIDAAMAEAATAPPVPTAPVTLKDPRGYAAGSAVDPAPLGGHAAPIPTTGA